MEGIQFENETEFARPQVGATSKKGLTGWLIQQKFAKDEQHANFLLIGILVTCLVITAIACMSLFGGDGTLTPEERAQLEKTTQMQTR